MAGLADPVIPPGLGDGATTVVDEKLTGKTSWNMKKVVQTSGKVCRALPR